MIQFQADYNNVVEHRSLFYDTASCSFDMEPVDKKWDFEVILNQLGLCVVKKNITQLWGFCGLAKDMLHTYSVPKYKKGQLRVLTALDHGFCYGINKKDYSIYVNDKTGWVCIGNPLVQQQAVEFIDNCVAVVENKNLVALWLKPVSLPMLSAINGGSASI